MSISQVNGISLATSAWYMHLAAPGADLLVDGDGHVAPVERQHREQVEDPEEDVDDDEDVEEVADPGLGRLGRRLHDADDRTGPGCRWPRPGWPPWRWSPGRTAGRSPLGEKRWPTPTTDAHMKWPELGTGRSHGVERRRPLGRLTRG